MLNTIFGKIDRCLFNGELYEASEWATLQAKDLMTGHLTRNECIAKLTKAIGAKYHKLSPEGVTFLASTAILLAKLGGNYE